MCLLSFQKKFWISCTHLRSCSATFALFEVPKSGIEVQKKKRCRSIRVSSAGILLRLSYLILIMPWTVLIVINPKCRTDGQEDLVPTKTIGFTPVNEFLISHLLRIFRDSLYICTWKCFLQDFTYLRETYFKNQHITQNSKKDAHFSWGIFSGNSCKIDNPD